MTEQSVVDWVRQVKELISEEEITKRLKESGWSDAIIDDVMTHAKQPVMTTVPSLADNKMGMWAGNSSPSQPVVEVLKANPNTFDGFNKLDCADRQVNVVFEMKHPHVVVVDNFMSDGECELMIERANPFISRSTVIEHGTANNIVDNVRTSQGMFFSQQQDEFIKTIENRISEFVKWPVENGEGMQVLRYGVGDEYRPHNDYFNKSDPASTPILARGGQRVATVLIYLNDVEAGGGTIFPESHLEVKPKRGTAIFFGYPTADGSSRTLHGGSPVVRGEKWVCVKWFRENKFI